MDNLEYLEKQKYAESESNDIEYRKTKALEIIAEQLIHIDNTLEAVVTVLENIETTLNRR